MLKNAGILLILLSGTGLGYSKGREFVFREKNIRIFLQLVIFLKGEIRCGNTSLPDAFREISGRMTGIYRGFLEEFCEGLENSTGRSLGDVYRQCALEKFRKIPLSEEERELIASLGMRLGYLDREMQLRQLELCEEETLYCLEKLRRELPEKKKIYQSLGVMGGILLAVLLW